MCLLVFAHDSLPEYPLVFAGNRDEFYDRPTAPAQYWSDEPHVLAGRDLKAGGTWMGVTRNGYWGVVTNVRDPDAYREDARSRGALVADYLRDEPEPVTYLEQVAADADRYNGFNLILGTPGHLYYCSNRGVGVQRVESGIHGLSNDRLNTPWPKVRRAKEKFESHLEDGEPSTERLLGILNDRRLAASEQLPNTGIGKEREKMLSSIFIETPTYGTRASTILLVRRDGKVTFIERTFDHGEKTDTRHFSFTVDSGAVE